MSDWYRAAGLLRLAFFQAANAARRQDPQPAGFYHQLMTQQGHCHTQACVAVARKLVERTWTVLHRGTRYQIRDLDGQPISQLEAKKMIIKQVCTVPDEIRAKTCAQRSHEPSQADPLSAGGHTRPFLR